MPSPPPLQPGCYYHVYNRGNNGEDLFREERNYEYFLRLYAHHIHPVAETLAYCLLRNHFHLAIRVRETPSSDAVTTSESENGRLPPASQAFANMFNAYTKAINKAFGRTGGLFENPYRRIHIQTDAYFTRVIAYIHRNPQKHGFVPDFREWRWSSYHALLSHQTTRMQREQVLAWFDGRERFEAAHLNAQVDTSLLAQDFE